MSLLAEILSGKRCARAASEMDGSPVPSLNIDLDDFRQKASSMEVFNIDNVTEYLYAQTDQEEWDVTKDFPCLAPPFPTFWMEFHRPSKIVSCVTGTNTTEDWPYAIGLLFGADRIDDPGAFQQDRESLQKQLDAMKAESEKRCSPQNTAQIIKIRDAGANVMDLKDPRWQALTTEAKELLGFTVQIIALTKALKDPESVNTFREQMTKDGVRWVLQCNPFMQIRRHGPVIGPLATQMLFLREDGSVAHENSKYNLHLVRREAFNNHGGGISCLWFSGLLAISFLHCKNVTVKREPGMPLALQRRQAKRGQPAYPTVFKTLEITPLRKVLEKAGAESDTGLKRALHICRGHFADFTKGKGLFGKLPGRFWIPQHMRGSVQEGVVLKDYKVNVKGQ